MDYIKAFVTGGLLCAAVQILMDKTKLMPGRIMVLLVVCGSILGAIGLLIFGYLSSLICKPKMKD